jgi:2-polyprenyl-3-methyl-5-hydroxy-6-metoxy-1,4-benzoquinol methylase
MNDNGLELEVKFWDWVINPETRKPFVQKRIDVDKQDFIDSCGEFFFNLLLHAKPKPRLLDVGAGPVSRLMWGAANNLIDIVSIDPLADEYLKLLNKYNVSIPVKPIQGKGESIVDQFGENSFDIVYCCNALDHSERPFICALNMVAALKAGGYLMIEGFTKEGTHEKYVGLHQHDLCVEDNNLSYTDKQKNKTILFRDNVKCIYTNNPGSTPGEWFKIIFQKQHENT